MSRRYYGLPRASGFAEGFQGGFGLVQDYFDSKKKDRRYEDEQAFTRQKYQDELNLKRDELAETRRANQWKEDFDTRQQDILATQTDTAATTQDRLLLAEQRAGLDAEDRRETNELNRKKAQFELTQQEELAGEIQENRTNNELLMESAQLTSKLFNYFESSIADGSYDPAEGRRLLEEVRASGKTAGAAANLDFEGQLSPSVYGSIEAFAAEIEKMRSGEDVDVNAVLDMANLAILRGNNEMGVGATITEDSHPNAPARVQDGSWKVKSKRVAEIVPTNDLNEDGDATFKFTVDVIAVDANGREFVYNAPLTVSRKGESEQVVLSTKDFLDAGAGIASFNKNARQYKSFARRARVQADSAFQDDRKKYDENKYTEWLGKKFADWAKDNKNAEDAPSVVPGLTNSELAENREALEDYFLTKRYNPGDILPRAENNRVDQVLDKIRNVPEIKEIETQLKGKLTRAQLLEAQQFLQRGKDEQLILDKSDKKSFLEFRNRITGRNTSDTLERDRLMENPSRWSLGSGGR